MKSNLICYINKYFIGECFVCYEIVGRGFLPPPPPHILWRPPHPLPTPHFWNFAQTPSSPSPPPPLLLLLSYFFGWMGDHATFYAPLNDIMDLYVKPWYLSTKTTLIRVLCNKASSLMRSDTYGFLLVLWFDITHTHAHTKTYSTLRGQ